MEDNNIITKVDKALAELKKGNLIIVTDNKDRENEGDLIGLSAFATPKTVNYMLQKGRGLICVPMSSERAKQLNLRSMVAENTEKFGTDFTLSVDAVDTITGVSAFDRAMTIKQLSDYSIKANNFESPGHMFPLIADDLGLAGRQGHTEAAVELAQLAGVTPVGYIVEILNPDGTMARGSDLKNIAERENLSLLSIKDIIAYKKEFMDGGMYPGATVSLPTEYGDFILKEYRNSKGDLDVPNLLLKSKNNSDVTPLVRIHSECFTGDTLGSLRCECGPQLRESLKMIHEHGGYLLYLRQEGRGIGLHEKLRTYVLQENGYDTYSANTVLGHAADERSYTDAVKILKANGVSAIRLITNNPDKVKFMENNGIHVSERVPLIIQENKNNSYYLETKKNRFGHLL
jgi:3,4-dihydroxy 2-butanone 4-phosphate synthase / GTP cyclohydrolase II